jgi:hypothetical protein
VTRPCDEHDDAYFRVMAWMRIWVGPTRSRDDQ